MQHSSHAPVVFITGGVKRVGATVARRLHAEGMNLVLHYLHSAQEAHALQDELLAQRADSVLLLQADLDHTPKLQHMVQQIIAHYGRLDVLINNASRFYPTRIGEVDEHIWQDLMSSNLKAPFFLAQAAAQYLQQQQGCIINMVDIHAKRPLAGHSVYCVAKAGLMMLTESLAKELGSTGIRVNAVAPGAILWPENEMDDVAKQRIVSNTALKRHGDPNDIAKTILFLIKDATYMTGQVLAVDGGRTLNQ